MIHDLIVGCDFKTNPKVSSANGRVAYDLTRLVKAHCMHISDVVGHGCKHWRYDIWEHLHKNKVKCVKLTKEYKNVLCLCWVT